MKATTSHIKSSAIIALVCLAYGGLNLWNGRFEMWDLRVYYDAAGALIDETSPYHRAFGLSSGFFKYSPAAAALFVPFHLIGWLATRIVFFLIISISLAWYLPRLVDQIARLFQRNDRSLVWVIALTAIITGGHFSRELLLGNVNWLLLLVLLVAFFNLDKRPHISGVLLGVALAFKPHFVVLLPWFVLRRRWHELAWAGGALMILFFLPAAGWGWSENLNLLNEWIATMQSHNHSLAESLNTLYGLPSRVFDIESTWLVVLTIGLVAIGIFIAMLRNYWKEATANERAAENMFLEFAFILAIIPNLVHTDTEHFMWTLPLIVLMLINLQRLGRLTQVVAAILVLVAMIPYTLTTPDLFGDEGARWLEQSGVLGWSNVLLIGVALWSEKRERKLNSLT